MIARYLLDDVNGV